MSDELNPNLTIQQLMASHSAMPAVDFAKLTNKTIAGLMPQTEIIFGNASRDDEAPILLLEAVQLIELSVSFQAEFLSVLVFDETPRLRICIGIIWNKDNLGLDSKNQEYLARRTITAEGEATLRNSLAEAVEVLQAMYGELLTDIGVTSFRSEEIVPEVFPLNKDE